MPHSGDLYGLFSSLTLVLLCQILKPLFLIQGLNGLSRADDYEQVKQVCEYYADYRSLFEGAGTQPGEKALEDKFFEYEVGACLPLPNYLLPNFFFKAVKYRLIMETRQRFWK